MKILHSYVCLPIIYMVTFLVMISPLNQDNTKHKSIRRSLLPIHCSNSKSIGSHAFGNTNGNPDDFKPSQSIPRPNIIVPSRGSPNNLEKFLMMYTCKICVGRNAHMVSKVAYYHGMVVVTCRHCKSKHLIADNERKLDFPEEYGMHVSLKQELKFVISFIVLGKRIEEFLINKGERVQKLQINSMDLEDNYLIDNNGMISLVPKVSGQVELP